MNVNLVVNGERRQFDLEPRTLLVDLIRNGMGLTGTRIGCDTSQCGACTVLLDGLPVKACTVLAVQADGQEVTTVEALPPPVDVVRQGFVAEHGLQCGFCTSGMVVTATALLAAIPSPTEADVEEWFEGNLCRCTGYVGIRRAIRWAATALAGEQPLAVAGTDLAEPLVVTEVQGPTVADTGFEVV